MCGRKVRPSLPRSWLWYNYYIFVLHMTTLIYVCNTFLVKLTKLLTLFRGLFQRTGTKSQPITRQHPCMASSCLHFHLLQFHYHGIAKSTCHTYQSGLAAYLSFCSRFSIDTMPASSMTLQYFYADRLQHISYKTLKVYLAAICMMHLEQGLTDPTTDESLHLVRRGTRLQQDNPEKKRLPIAIDLLITLKSQLYLTNYSLLEQHTLWSSFTLSFYAFLHSSECLSLTLNDITITETSIVIVLHQSKTDPF